MPDEGWQSPQFFSVCARWIVKQLLYFPPFSPEKFFLPLRKIIFPTKLFARRFNADKVSLVESFSSDFWFIQFGWRKWEWKVLSCLQIHRLVYVTVALDDLAQQFSRCRRSMLTLVASTMNSPQASSELFRVAQLRMYSSKHPRVEHCSWSEQGVYACPYIDTNPRLNKSRELNSSPFAVETSFEWDKMET